jgi:hypothetical protein
VGDTAYRVETDQPLEEAIRIAESLRREIVVLNGEGDS